MSQLVTQAEFGRLMGCSRSWVTQLKNEGRLVMAEGKVDVEASKNRIAETADPNRDDVAARHAQGRQPAQQQTQQDFPGSDKVGSSYQTARAVKERYMALHAKADYEQKMGLLINRDDVRAAVTDMVTSFRQTLENIPHRLAADLVGQDHDYIRAALKREVHDTLAEMQRACDEKIKAQVTE